MNFVFKEKMDYFEEYARNVKFLRPLCPPPPGSRGETSLKCPWKKIKKLMVQCLEKHSS
jgi:hypothetical protein